MKSNHSNSKIVLDFVINNCIKDYLNAEDATGTSGTPPGAVKIFVKNMLSYGVDKDTIMNHARPEHKKLAKSTINWGKGIIPIVRPDPVNPITIQSYPLSG